MILEREVLKMAKLVIEGGRRLQGELEVHGSKNAVLPILAASILNSGISIIRNCPRLKDVEIMVEILRTIGCKASWEGPNTVCIDSLSINSNVIPEDLAAEMRSSVIFLGPMLARLGSVTVSYPGGCEIGPRPIDLHIKGLREMGAIVHDTLGGFIYCEARKVKGCDIHLDYPSVGATENIMLASVFADGVTCIRNAAKEPEIVDLQDYLRKMGINVRGAGTGVIMVEGTGRDLPDVDKTVIPDRIVAGTYIVAAAATGGELLLKNTIPEHVRAVIHVARECGCEIKEYGNSIRVSGPERPRPVDSIRTLPYPGFPTDMQPQVLALLTTAHGTSIIVETVFENRYKHVEELLRMGANIKVEGRIAIIKGVRKLVGANVRARDLRGGAALVIAGLGAQGTTVVDNVKHIDRGYENIEKYLSQVGANIIRMGNAGNNGYRSSKEKTNGRQGTC
jgi:UDP-N-acetylglucosamine 1-carboxyvinyltransferase